MNIKPTQTDKQVITAVCVAHGNDSLKELAGVYNDLAKHELLDQPLVKRFSDRKSALRRIEKLALQLRDALKLNAPKTGKGAPAKKSAVAKQLESAGQNRRGKGGVRHDPNLFRSAYVKDALRAGREDLDAIAEECQAKFPHVKTERHHVTWYRWQLRKAGEI